MQGRTRPLLTYVDAGTGSWISTLFNRQRASILVLKLSLLWSWDPLSRLLCPVEIYSEFFKLLFTFWWDILGSSCIFLPQLLGSDHFSKKLLLLLVKYLFPIRMLDIFVVFGRSSGCSKTLVVTEARNICMHVQTRAYSHSRIHNL
jgi:hypothetical protein